VLRSRPRVKSAKSLRMMEKHRTMCLRLHGTEWRGWATKAGEGRHGTKHILLKGLYNSNIRIIILLISRVSYMNSDMAERHEVTASIHRALVEVYTLKQEGLPLTMDYHAYDLYNDYPWRLAEDATFELDGQGGMRAVFRSEGLRQDILESVRPREDTAGDVVQREEQTEEYMEGVEPNIGEADSMPDQESTPPTIEPDSLKSEDSEDEEFSRSDRQRAMGGEDQISPADDSWQDVALEDPLIKFAVSCGTRSQPH